MKGFYSVLFLFMGIVQTSMAQEGYEANSQRMMKRRGRKRGKSNFFPPLDPAIGYYSQGKKGHGGKSFANRSPAPPTPPYSKSHGKGKGNNSYGKSKSKNASPIAPVASVAPSPMAPVAPAAPFALAPTVPATPATPV